MKGFALACLMLWPLTAWAEGERAGDFDYYVLSLSWAPGWCATDGAGRDAAQCDPANEATFVLHGLWPQYEEGWPSYCRTVERDPTRGETAAMADIMGGAGLAFYQWKKHGRCSGLSAAKYYATARQAFAQVRHTTQCMNNKNTRPATHGQPVQPRLTKNAQLCNHIAPPPNRSSK